MTTHTLFSLFICTSLFAAVACKSRQYVPKITPPAPISTTIDLARSNGGNRLTVNLTNQTDNPINLYAHELPWVSRNAIVLILEVDEPTRRQIKEALTVEDILIRETILNPYNILSGEIDLNQRFPDLARELKSHGVLLFWSYKAPKQLERNGGFIYIKKEQSNPSQVNPKRQP
jgi:hypothetical protein